VSTAEMIERLLPVLHENARTFVHLLS
jgi:hypothetical protein